MGYKGHTLTTKQAEKLNEAIQYVKEIHEIYGDPDSDVQDTVDELLSSFEEFVFELGAVNRKVF